jgi:hypothetical protein
MTREDLLKSASALTPPPSAAAEEYGRMRERLAAEINRIMTSRPDAAFLSGGNLAMMEDNHRNHARFMASLFTAWDPGVLVDTVLWVFRAYRSHGFPLTYWPAQLDTWAETLKRELSAEGFRSIYPVYHWMIVHQPAFVALSDRELASGGAPAH